jgi:hypothetical protein
VQQTAAAIIGGKSANAIRGTLNSQGIPGPAGGQWVTSSLLRVLRTPIINGRMVVGGQPVRADDGLPVVRAGIVDDQTWTALQAALDRVGKPGSGIRQKASLLLRVAFCTGCGSAMHHQWSSDRDRAYYVCSSARGKRGCAQTKMIRDGLLEQLVEDELVRAVGADTPMRGKRIISALDHSAEITRLTGVIDDLEAQVIAGVLAPEVFARTVTRTEKQRAELEALPAEPQRIDRPLTGQTFGQHWESLDAAGRHALLLSSDVEVWVERSDDDESMPMPDADGRTVLVILPGWRVTLYLGDLAVLRDLATAQTDQQS